jgi:hypothetical protein
MSIYYQIKSSHEKMKRLLEEVLEHTDKLKVQDIIYEIESECKLTFELESLLLYEFLLKHLEIERKIQNLIELHKKIHLTSLNLIKLFNEGLNWQKKVMELKNHFHHYLRQEEKVVFANSKKILDKKKEIKLGYQFLEFKRSKIKFFTFKIMRILKKNN